MVLFFRLYTCLVNVFMYGDCTLIHQKGNKRGKDLNKEVHATFPEGEGVYSKDEFDQLKQYYSRKEENMIVQSEAKI